MTRTPERWQRLHDVPAVAGRVEPRVEHGDDAPVVGRADQAAGGLGEQRGGARDVDLGERLGSGLLASGFEQRVVWPREGQLVDHDERQRRAGHVDALEQPGGGEQAGRFGAGEGGDQRGLGQLALVIDAVGHALAHGGRRGVHRLPAGEQRERATTGGQDQLDEFVVHGRRVLGPARVGQMGGAVQEPGRRVVERAADVHLVGALGRQADATHERARDRGAREDGGARLPHHRPQHRGDIDRGDHQRRPVGGALHPSDVSGRHRERGIEVGGQRRSGARGAQLALLHLVELVVDLAQRGQDLFDIAARRRERAGDAVGQRSGKAHADVGGKSSGQRRADGDDRRGQLLGGEHLAHRAGQRDEPSGAEGDASRVGDRVLELVGLVEHDDIVLG